VYGSDRSTMSRYSSILYISFHVLSRRVDTIWCGAGRLYKLVVTPGAKEGRRSRQHSTLAVVARACSARMQSHVPGVGCDKVVELDHGGCHFLGRVPAVHLHGITRSGDRDGMKRPVLSVCDRTKNAAAGVRVRGWCRRGQRRTARADSTQTQSWPCLPACSQCSAGASRPVAFLMAVVVSPR